MSRDLLFVAIALVTWGVGEGMFLYFQPLYLQELGASPIEIGNIMGIIGVTMSAAHLPAGYLADKIGRRPLLLTAWIMGCTSAWIMALSNSLPVFVFGSAFYGLTSFVMVPLNSYVTAAKGNWSVGRAITLISAIYSIGALLGPLIGGWSGNKFGLHSNFMLAAILFLVSTSIIFFIRPQPIEPKETGESQTHLFQLLKGRYLKYLVIVFLVMFAMYLPQPLSQNFLQNERGLDLTQIGVLISARGLGIVLLNLILGGLNARIGFLLSQGFMASFTILIWLGTGFPWYYVGYLMMGSYQTARALASAQGRILLKASNMGTGYGLIETAVALAAILAPPLAGRLYAWDPVSIYSISLLLIVGSVLITLIFSPIKSSDLEQLPDLN